MSKIQEVFLVIREEAVGLSRPLAHVHPWGAADLFFKLDAAF